VETNGDRPKDAATSTHPESPTPPAAARERRCAYPITARSCSRLSETTKSDQSRLRSNVSPRAQVQVRELAVVTQGCPAQKKCRVDNRAQADQEKGYHAQRGATLTAYYPKEGRTVW